MAAASTFETGIKLTDFKKNKEVLAINLKKLQSIARRKLQLNGPVEWTQAPKSQQTVLGKGYLSTRYSGESHVIMYSDVSSLSEVDVYHELCKARLYEL